jgi:tetratricopeptide (TPR) repeat protein
MKAWLQRGFRVTAPLWRASELRVNWKGMTTTLPAYDEYDEVLQTLTAAVKTGPFLLREQDQDLILTDFAYNTAVSRAEASLDLLVVELGKGVIPQVTEDLEVPYIKGSRPLQDIVDEAERYIEQDKGDEACKAMEEGLVCIDRESELTKELADYYGLYAITLHLADRRSENERMLGFLDFYLRLKQLTLTRVVAEAYFIAGSNYLEDEQPNEAAEVLMKAAEFSGTTDQDCESRVMICLKLAELFEAEDETEFGAKYAEMGWAAVEEAGRTSECIAGRLLHLRANFLLAKGNFDEALSWLEQAVQIYDEAGDAEPIHYALLSRDLGLTYIHLSMLEKASQALYRAEEILDDNDETELANDVSASLIDILVDLGQIKEAERVIARAFARPADSLLNRLKLATAAVYKEQGRLDEALRMAKEACAGMKEDSDFEEENSDQGKAYLVLGQVHLEMGELDKAEKELKLAIERLAGEDCSSERFTAHSELMQICYQRPDLEAALLHAKKAYDIANNDADFEPLGLAQASEWLGKLQFELGRPEGVKEMLKRGLKLRVKHLGGTDPGVLSSYANYGNFLLQSGELMKAEAALVKGLEVIRMHSLQMSSPDVKEVFELLKALYKAKDDTDASERLERIVSQYSK